VDTDELAPEASMNLPDPQTAHEFGQGKIGIEQGPGAKLRVHGPELEMALAFETESFALIFRAQHAAIVTDLALACSDPGSGDAFLWLGTDRSSLWLLCVTRHDSLWEGQAIERPYVDFLDVRTAPSAIREFRRRPNREQAKRVLEFLRDKTQGLGLSRTFPLFTEAEAVIAGQERRLTVKLEPGCEWFVLVPIEYLATSRLNRPVAWHVEWIATAKTFVRNLQERNQIANEISDLPIFLRHAVVILNTYRIAGFDERLIRATERVSTLLSLLKNVNVQIGGQIESFSLRAFLNPTATEIGAILHDPSTWFVLADFHVENGTWQLGDEHGEFPVKSLASDSLRHVRLLRIFHCNSMLDHAGGTGFQDSIVSVLLRAGAMRVEGSPFVENYIVFLRQLVRFIVNHPSLRVVLLGQSMAQEADLDRLFNEIHIAVNN
jgi:hypothetical protein